MALPSRPHLSKLVVAVVIACGLLSLIWFNTKGQLHTTYDSLSKKAKQSAASTTSAFAHSHNVTTLPTSIFDERADVDAHSLNVTTPPTSISDERADVDAHSLNVTTPPTSISDEQADVDTQPAPFPLLPPSDDREYMAICMVGEYL